MQLLPRILGAVFAPILLVFALATPGQAMAATLTVNATLDSDDGFCSSLSSTNSALECTLREAINGANTLAGGDTITFAIPGNGVRTIRPLSPLPAVEQDVVVDGYTQPGSAPNTLVNGDNAVLRIELDGSLAGPGATGLVLGARNTVRGLAINCFGGAAISINGRLDSFSREIVGENVVVGSFLGTDSSGTLARPNTDGVVITSAGNSVGGEALAARNLISGNNDYAVVISGTPSTVVWDNVIYGNYIGTNAAGTGRLGNGSGVFISAGARSNHVSANIISANVGHGVEVFRAVRAPGNGSVDGNKIGTDVSGTLNLGNGGSGVLIQGADKVDVIGNTIAFNGISGVDVRNAIGVHIRFNSIFSNTELGIDLDGVGVTANDSGDRDGAATVATALTGVNRDDPTLLANYHQNFPLITSAVSGGGTTTVSGRLDSHAQIPFWIEVFSNPFCDPSGHGEGRTLLGRSMVITDASGQVGFTRTFAAAVPLGSAITATATDANDPAYSGYNPNVSMGAGDTSEFSPCFAVAPRLVPVLSVAGAKIVGDERGSTAVYAVTLSDTSDDVVSVDFATVDGKASAGIDYEPQKGTLVFEPGETSKTIAVRVFAEAATEPDAFAVLLADPVNATIGAAAADSAEKGTS